jgi:hypothetical protein
MAALRRVLDRKKETCMCMRRLAFASFLRKISAMAITDERDFFVRSLLFCLVMSSGINVASHSKILHCTVLYCIVLYCIVLYCIVLYCVALSCIVLYFIVFW